MWGLMLVTMSYYAWRHGWDHGFVLFLVGFYGCVGQFLYFLLVVPLLPVELKLIAGPVSKAYLSVEPLSSEAYESRISSDKPLGIT